MLGHESCFKVSWQALLFLTDGTARIPCCSSPPRRGVGGAQQGCASLQVPAAGSSCRRGAPAPSVQRPRCAAGTAARLGAGFLLAAPATNAKQTTLLHRAGLVSQQSPRKRSQAESAFANLIAFQRNTGNSLQEDKWPWRSCQCIMMSNIFFSKALGGPVFPVTSNVPEVNCSR